MQTNPSVHQTLEEMDFERGLWYGAVMGDAGSVSSMLKKGHRVDETDASGYTALHYAAKNGFIDIVKILLDAGASVGARTKAGQATPLHRAAGAGKLEVCKLLIDKRSDVGSLDVDGRTPLHRAVENERDDIVDLLIEIAPHTLQIKDVKGLTPYDIAKSENMKNKIENEWKKR
ncbi:ankyrin repeat domain-containing protein 39-like [Cimex lectularius]|uniref:Ankyrin repeat domain-containing protein 39 n=1 Tax=Cimex lectularius TaxID=79782 RepID=A0A8I6RVG0_CIMLE|nr:ankyrin repeat domain-containing protein 39-like [Cimex lectularius]